MVQLRASFAGQKSYSLNSALLCDSSLLVMSAKYKKSEVFSYFTKVRGEYFFEQRAFKHIFAFVCACLKEHMRVDYVFCVLYMVFRVALLAAIITTATVKAFNECKTLGLC